LASSTLSIPKQGGGWFDVLDDWIKSDATIQELKTLVENLESL